MLKQILLLFLFFFFLPFFLKKSKPQAEQNPKELWQDDTLKTSEDLDWLNLNYFTFLAFLYCVCLTWKCIED